MTGIKVAGLRRGESSGRKLTLPEGSKMGIEFLKSKIWLRWLELREKSFFDLSKGERTEYRKLEPVVCKELTKLQPYIPGRSGAVPKKRRE